MSTDNSRRADSHRSLIKSTSILSIGTLTSRIFGFLRDVVLAKMLGTGFSADAFFVALRIPNLFRDLVGEGATNSAVVPIFSEYKHSKSAEEFWRFASIVLSLAMIALSVIVILGVLFAPVIVRLIVPGFMADAAKLELTIKLTRILFPYLVFIGLTAYSMGILYTFRSFAIPAFTHSLLNISIVISALVASRTMEEPVFGIAAGVLVGGVLQLAFQIWPMIRIGMRLSWPKSLKHEGAKRIGMLLIPRMLGSGVYQLTVLIDTFCASIASVVGPGGISAIYYSNRIINLPMGLFSVALASAALPTLSSMASKKDHESMKKTIVFALENIFFVMCPTTVILMILSTPIIRVLFERGAFDVYSTHITSSALSFFALGLFSFGSIKIMVTAFHALQDTKTPVKVAALCLGINTVLNFILMFPFKVAGIALASAIAGTVDFLVLFYILDKRLDGLNGGLWRFFVKVAFASLLMGLFELISWKLVTFIPEAAKLFIIGGLGFVFYWGVCLAVKITQAHKILDWIKGQLPDDEYD
ncbi:MAG TPA: murein biosynthesis integral membrane protein MurJ [Candidatus Omnitrophota bacterium]|nr:murein biosynthesis integral membrane protein MurJ [Candidatus Omnitrophota bacterium]